MKAQNLNHKKTLSLAVEDSNVFRGNEPVSSGAVQEENK